MVELYNRMENYILSLYEDYPLEIRKKMRNLLFTDFISFIGWILLFLMGGVLNYIENCDFTIFIRDFVVLGLILVSIILLKLKKPVLASYTTMSILFTIVYHPIIKDLIGISSESSLILYRTLVILIIGNLFLSTYSLKQLQIVFYTLISIITFIIHSIIIKNLYFEGRFTFEFYALSFEALFFLLITSAVCLFLFRLTSQNRFDFIDNIILFKMTRKGPTPVFWEHPMNYDVLLECGVYFYTAVGQGLRYLTGLFGPLPFGDDSKHIALIYTTLMKDSAFEIPRMKGQNYIMFAFIAKTDKIDFLERNKFLEIIQNETSKIKDLAGFNDDEFQEFAKVLHSY
ncbi:MAG: membrane protein of unknown function [Promethearchaeota archaeon]|nr:MAG: membrane protein of unknown function [Candidatus Lokiarchaeota archaeon]